MSLDHLPSGLHSIWNPARRWRATVTATVHAPSFSVAASAACYAEEAASTIVDPVVVSLDEIPYPHDDIAYPWRAALTAIRFGERRRDFEHSGWRWVSDHNMAIRLRKDDSSVLPVRVEDPFVLSAPRPLGRRDLAPMIWLDQGRETWLLVSSDRRVAVRADYVVAVETAVPDAIWHLPEQSREGPALAYDEHGLVAAVMGVAIHRHDQILELTEEHERMWATVQQGLRVRGVAA